MSIPALKYCPSLLTENHNTYSPLALRRLFKGRKVSHILPYDSPWSNDDETEKFMDNNRHIHISGVQEKYSLIQIKNELRLTEKGEQGTHILKPYPVTLKRPREIPANEHVTMQIASQVFKIDTAPCAIIFFRNGEPAYLTKRFDIKNDGSKRVKEDFAALAGTSLEVGGKNFKYNSSYEEMGNLIKKYVSASAIELEKFFSLILFNYLFSNGDAHLKNFALLETDSGDYTLSPAYDLMNTRLHIDDTDFAFAKGLFADEWKSDAYQHYGHASKEDFLELAKRLGMATSRIEKILATFLNENPLIELLVSRSFLDVQMKQRYLENYRTKLKNLKASRK